MAIFTAESHLPFGHFPFPFSIHRCRLSFAIAVRVEAELARRTSGAVTHRAMAQIAQWLNGW
jgi:hypothetical protein